MKIKTIEIRNIVGGNLKGNTENIRHIKSLPCLSVVQSVHGHYEISLNGGKPCATEEGGAFVAPAGTSQNILHHNGAEGYMEAQWVFMNIIVNDLFEFEDLFDVPLLLSADAREELSESISTIGNDPNICKKYAAAYRLTDLVLAHTSMKNTVYDHSAILLRKYIAEHCGEKITNEALANVAICSVPHLYRIFQKNFHLSPRNYIKKIRIEKASVLLENSSRSVAEISEEVGFEDPVYFSKLFKEHYRLSPKKYREISLSVNCKDEVKK